MNDCGAQKSILIVDDNPDICMAIQDLLESDGYRVVCVNDGRACLDFVLDDPPDLIILDVVMPQIGGIEVCRRLKENPKAMSIPIIFVTGQYDYESRILCKKAGGDEFLNKPIDATELLIRAQNLLKLKHYHDLILRDRDLLEQKVLERTVELRDTHEEMLIRLSMAAEYKEGIVGAHLTRISRFAECVARAYGIEESRVHMIRIGAICHDIGKIAVPESILEKPGPLTEDEWAIMRTHSEIGARILSNSKSDLIKIAENIARYHHEDWDGSGYPEGLTGDSIPLSARIVRVVDVFDALVSKRSYKDAYSIDESLAIIQDEKGRQFDPDIVDTFLREVDTIEAVMERFNENQDENIGFIGSWDNERQQLYV
ncbi:MAG: response regulator [Candidatus Hinthialibacter antarcticus]|nr:response regulator [Candidatus Hinthialibacter antarcticus]